MAPPGTQNLNVGTMNASLSALPATGLLVCACQPPEMRQLPLPSKLGRV